jgi:molybdopterin-guanine dinucleotide biosynthesis protein A
MLSALGHCRTPLLVSAPCDSPLVRRDLVARLVEAMEREDAEIAVAHDGDRMQPVFALLRTELAPSLERFLASGGRKIDRWFESRRTALADFRDATQMFANVNTPDERDALEAAVLEHAP